MKKNILPLLIIIAVCGFSAFGQKKPFDELKFNLIALKSQVLPVEPIPFKLKLTNNTDSPITVAACFTFQGGALSLEIKRPNGKVVVPSQLSFLNGRRFCQVFPKDIPSGEKMETTELFSFEHYKYFGQAGDYQVRASFRNNDGKVVRSEWANIAVAQPLAIEKDAYEYLLKKMEKDPKDFRPFTTWSIDEMEEFVLLYPGTTYANYVRYDLAQSYYEREKGKAEAHLRQIQDRDFVYAQEVSEKLKILEAQKKQD